MCQNLKKKTNLNYKLNSEDSYDIADNKPYCAMHIKQFITPTKSAKKAVVYDTVNNVIQVKDFEELKIDTTFRTEMKIGVKSPTGSNQAQFSPAGKQISQPNSPAMKLQSQPNSPASKQVSQQNSPVVKQVVSQPGSPTKQFSPRQQQQFSPGSPAPKSPVS